MFYEKDKILLKVTKELFCFGGSEMDNTKADGRSIKSMTEGNVMHLILAFSLPIFIGNLFQQLSAHADGQETAPWNSKTR
jgi:hypothetical protein